MVAGSVLLFVSWVAQNYQQSTWADERQRLMRSQSVLDVGEVRMEHWLALFMAEKAKVIPDRKLLGAYGYKLLQSDRNLAAWGAVRLEKDGAAVSRIFQKRDDLLGVAYRLYQEEKTEDLVRLVEQTLDATIKAGVVERDTQRFFDAVDVVNQQEEFWNRTFLLSYVLGALLIGVAYLLDWRRATGPPNQAHPTAPRGGGGDSPGV